ncbi:MAG: glycosyltransferase [Patescibacteria group bacterium]|nr:glycosyltransferase [Patescibacteria group bacterium]
MKHLIIITSYRAPKLIKKCLDNLVLTTNLNSNKIVLVDDASDFKTTKILKKLEEKYPQINFVYNKKNISKPCSVNNVLRKNSNMDYYTILDQDVFIKTKNWDKILFKAHQVFKDKAILGVFTQEKGYSFQKGGFNFMDPYPFWTLAGRFFSFSKKIFSKLGYLYDKSYRHEDREYCFRAYLAGFRWYYLRDIKASTVIHSLTKRRKFELKRGEKEEKIIQKKRNQYLMLTHDIYYSPFKK